MSTVTIVCLGSSFTLDISNFIASSDVANIQSVIQKSVDTNVADFQGGSKLASATLNDATKINNSSIVFSIHGQSADKEFEADLRFKFEVQDSKFCLSDYRETGFPGASFMND